MMPDKFDEIERQIDLLADELIQQRADYERAVLLIQQTRQEWDAATERVLQALAGSHAE